MLPAFKRSPRAARAYAVGICCIIAQSLACESATIPLDRDPDLAATRGKRRGHVPNAVTDLRVAAITDSSATLGFTEVNDGTNQPASYDVRYAVSPILWDSATSVTRGSCTTPVGGTSIGAPRTCTVLGLHPPAGYQFQLVAFRVTADGEVLFGPLSNVASVPPESVPSVALSLDRPALLESGDNGPATVTATLSYATSQSVTVTLGVSGTATEGADYTVSGKQIVIPAGNLTGTQTVAAIPDAVAEGSETVVLDIESVVNGSESGVQRVSATIEDDDLPAVTAVPLTIARFDGALPAILTLAGTVLMACSIGGRGPGAFDSTVTLGSLVPGIARLRDEFYRQLLAKQTGPSAERWREESAKHRQPFGFVRQRLNAFMANARAQQLQQRRLALFYAELGRLDAGVSLTAAGRSCYRPRAPAGSPRGRRRGGRR